MEMEFTKEELKEKSQNELIEIIVKMRSDLKVANAWLESNAKEKVKLFEKLNGIVLPKD
jgi:hypothetical protein